MQPQSPTDAGHEPQDRPFPSRKPVYRVRQCMTSASPAAQQRALKILLIEDDPIDAAWITELIHGKGLGFEVAHSACLPQALLVLVQHPTDVVLVSVHPNDGTASTEICRELVSKAGGRPIVALVDVAELHRAADIYATGVRFIYGKHPIMRTAHIRKLELRERFRARFPEKEWRSVATTAAGLARSFSAIPNCKHQEVLCALAEPGAGQFNGAVPLLDEPG